MDIITILIGIASLFATICAILYAISFFKKTTTLQLEMYVLDSIEKYAHSKKNELDRELFLTTIDLYCKYDVNGLLSKKLCIDNLEFFKNTIEEYRQDVISNPSYNNIRDYIEKYKYEC